MTTVVSQLVEGCGRFDKKHVELVNLSFTILGSSLKSLEFLSISVPLTPPPNRYRSKGYYNIKYPACLKGIHNTHTDL